MTDGAQADGEAETLDWPEFGGWAALAETGPAPWVGDGALELIDRHTAGPREALERLGRLAVGSQSGADCWTLAFDRLLRLLATHAVDKDRKPARRGVGLEFRTAVDESLFRKARKHALRKSIAQSLEGFGRQFLGEELDQQRVLHGV